MNSMPARSAIWASRTQSGQLPHQRSGTIVTARPEAQLAPNRPSLSRLLLPIAARFVSIGVASLFIALLSAEFIAVRFRYLLRVFEDACGSTQPLPPWPDLFRPPTFCHRSD